MENSLDILFPSSLSHRIYFLWLLFHSLCRRQEASPLSYSAHTLCIVNVTGAFSNAWATRRLTTDVSWSKARRFMSSVDRFVIELMQIDKVGLFRGIQRSFGRVKRNGRGGQKTARALMHLCVCTSSTCESLLSDPSYCLSDKETQTQESIPTENLDAAKPYLMHPDFNPEELIPISQAISNLCEWVLSVVEYNKIYNSFVKPKEVVLRGAQAVLEEIQK